MKKKLKTHWLVLLIALLITGLFCWFQVRPVIIRAKCWERMWKLLSESEKERVDTEDLKTIEILYEGCLHKYGLK